MILKGMTNYLQVYILQLNLDFLPSIGVNVVNISDLISDKQDNWLISDWLFSKQLAMGVLNLKLKLELELFELFSMKLFIQNSRDICTFWLNIYWRCNSTTIEYHSNSDYQLNIEQNYHCTKMKLQSKQHNIKCI